MKNQERLRLELARAIYSEAPAIQPWDGDPYGFHELGASFERDRAFRMADAAIARLEALADVSDSSSSQDSPLEWEYGVQFESYVVAEATEKSAIDRTVHAMERMRSEKRPVEDYPKLMRRVTGPWAPLEKTPEEIWALRHKKHDGW